MLGLAAAPDAIARAAAALVVALEDHRGQVSSAGVGILSQLPLGDQPAAAAQAVSLGADALSVQLTLAASISASTGAGGSSGSGGSPTLPEMLTYDSLEFKAYDLLNPGTSQMFRLRDQACALQSAACFTANDAAKKAKTAAQQRLAGVGAVLGILGLLAYKYKRRRRTHV